MIQFASLRFPGVMRGLFERLPQDVGDQRLRLAGDLGVRCFVRSLPLEDANPIGYNWVKMTASDFLERMFGRRPEGMARVRMGRGVVGNTTYAFWAACAALVGVTFSLRGDPLVAAATDAGIIILYIVYLFATHRFADRHPDMAMLGDTEWLKYKSQLAGRGAPLVPPLPPVLDPHSSLPLIESTGKDDV